MTMPLAQYQVAPGLSWDCNRVFDQRTPKKLSREPTLSPGILTSFFQQTFLSEKQETAVAVIVSHSVYLAWT